MINNSDLLEYLIEYLNKNSHDVNIKLVIRDWINKKNIEGYSPMHMASFKGNIV